MKVFVGITGASGSVMAKILIGQLKALDIEAQVCFTDSGRRVYEHEVGKPDFEFASNDDIFAEASSGSSAPDACVIVPCSMSTLGEIASVSGKGLVARVADVCLKERRPLVLVARETPLNLLHIRNMESVTMAGGIVMPPCLPHYADPTTIDGLLEAFSGRILQTLGITNDFCKKWKGFIHENKQI